MMKKKDYFSKSFKNANKTLKVMNLSWEKIYKTDLTIKNSSMKKKEKCFRIRSSSFSMICKQVWMIVKES